MSGRYYTVVANNRKLGRWTRSYAEAVRIAQRWSNYYGYLGVRVISDEDREMFRGRDVSSRCKQGTRVQSLLLARTHFPSEGRAVSWAKKHGYRAYKVDVKPNTYRLRQADPSKFRNLRTIRLRPGVQAVVGCPR